MQGQMTNVTNSNKINVNEKFMLSVMLAVTTIYFNGKVGLSTAAVKGERMD